MNTKTRQDLWVRIKKSGLVNSKLEIAPPDSHIKMIIQSISCKPDKFFDILYGESLGKKQEIAEDSSLLG
jgi:hypothetical protein